MTSEGEGAAPQEPTIDPSLQAEADAVLRDIKPDPVGGEVVDDDKPDVPLDEVIGEFLDATFSLIVAPMAGEHWNLGKERCAMVGKAYAAVLLKYWPDLTIGEELFAVMATAMVFGPPVKITLAQHAERKAAEEAKKQSPDATDA